MQAKSTKELITELITSYRVAGNRDVAFDKLAAARLGISVTDLHSTNGTLLIAPDGSVRQLDPGEPALVALGTTVELAEGVSVLVDFPQ